LSLVESFLRRMRYLAPLPFYPFDDLHVGICFGTHELPTKHARVLIIYLYNVETIKNYFWRSGDCFVLLLCNASLWKWRRSGFFYSVLNQSYSKREKVPFEALPFSDKNWLVISGSYTIVRYTWPTLASRMAIFLEMPEIFLKKSSFQGSLWK
jgi:hypothetical protein